MSTGERIRSARKEAGLTTYQLAEKIGVSEAMLRHCETGRRNASDEQLAAIAKALKTNPESFAEYRIHSVRDILEVLKRLEEDGCTIETSEDGTKISVTVDPMGPHAPKLITAFKKWHESQRQQASS